MISTEVHLHLPLSCDLSALHISCVRCCSWSLICKTCHFLEGTAVCHVLPFHALCDNIVSKAACPCHCRKEQSFSSCLPQDLYTALKQHVDTTLSGSLGLVCQLLPMAHSRNKSEDCARKVQNVYALQCCTLQPQKVQIHCHKYIPVCMYLYPSIHTHTHTHTPSYIKSYSFFSASLLLPALPSQIPFKPIPWLGQNSTFTLTLQSNSFRQSWFVLTVALGAAAFGSCTIACLLCPWYTFSQQWKQLSSVKIQAVSTLVHLNINCFFPLFKSLVCLEFQGQLT